MNKEDILQEWEMVPEEIDGLPGDEESLAIEEMLMEVFYGREEEEIL